MSAVQERHKPQVRAERLKVVYPMHRTCAPKAGASAPTQDQPEEPMSRVAHYRNSTQCGLRTRGKPRRAAVTTQWDALNESERQRVIARVAQYHGNFKFLKDMARQAAQVGWEPTPAQGNAILKCYRSI